MRELGRRRALAGAMLAAALAGGCQAWPPRPTAALPADSGAAVGVPSPTAKALVAAPISLDPSDPRTVAFAAARVRWNALGLKTFAYSVRSWNSSGFGAFGVRVTSLEGAIRTQGVDGTPALSPRLDPDGLFDVAHDALAAEGTAEIGYDPATGLPTSIRASGPPNVIDADTNIDVTDFAGPKVDAERVRQAVAWALADWSRAQPASFTYTWTRMLAWADAPEATLEAARHAGGAQTFTPATMASGPDASTVASVPATLQAATAAAAAGAWVDLTTQFGNGVPLLLAIDPTPAHGDAYWIQIAFRDVEREQAVVAFRAARERWAAAGLSHYRYVWHYHGELGTYTYSVTMNGDVGRLTRAKGTAVLWQAIDVGPRLDVLVSAISDQIWGGGRVVAAYDPTYGFPVKVTLVSVGGTPSGTITISDFTVVP